MVKIDLKQKIKNLSGKDIIQGEGENASALTLGLVIAEALISDETTGKMKVYLLSQKAYSDKTMEVDPADFSLIKKAVENTKSFGGNAIIIGQAMLLLDEAK